MLDIKFIREHPEKVRGALKNRGVNFNLDDFLKLDEERRSKIKEVEDLRAELNKLSAEIAQLSAQEKKAKLQAAKTIKKNIEDTKDILNSLNERFYNLMYELPNLPLENVPIGKDESANKVIREVDAEGVSYPAGEGKKPQFNFKPRDYMEIARELDLIDTERAGKVSGSRFGYLKNEAVLLELALINFAMGELRSRDFIPIIPPVMIREKMLKGMGYIDSEKDRAERYFIEKDNLFLVGTSEQSIGPMHSNEIFSEEELPKRYAAFSTCFRREAGSYGRDTYGILRVHQFDKVEMFSFTKPEDSQKEHKLLLEMEERLMQALKLPYRVVQLCTGDLAHPSAATYDIEAWLPGQNNGAGEYRETHSTSNTTDFQARRLNIRFKTGGTIRFVHMLNGTAFAIGRTLIAILENYQQEDGSIRIPNVLIPYLRGLKIIKNKSITHPTNQNDTIK